MDKQVVIEMLRMYVSTLRDIETNISCELQDLEEKASCELQDLIDGMEIAIGDDLNHLIETLENDIERIKQVRTMTEGSFQN